MWAIIGIGAYILLPWYGLEYGLFDCTVDEFLDTMAWKTKSRLAILPLAFFLVCLVSPWRNASKKTAGTLESLLPVLVILTMIVGFTIAKKPMGIGTAFIVAALGGILARGSARLGFVRNDAFLSGAVLFVVATVAVFIFFPIVKIFIQVFYTRGGDFAPLQFFKIATSFGIGRILFNTVLMAVCVGLSTTTFGLIFAVYAVRATSRLRNVIKVFYILPIITPPFVVGLALILIFGRSGTFNDLLIYLFGDGGVFVPAGAAGFFHRSSYIYGFPGIFLAQTLSLTPVSYMLLVGMISSINPALEEASLTMSASRWETFRNVTLPLIRPGIANAFLLGVISSAADFGNPLVLGGEYDVLSTEIYFSIAGAQLDFARASSLGLILLMISLTVFLIQQRWIGKTSYVTIRGVQTSGKVTPLDHSGGRTLRQYPDGRSGKAVGRRLHLHTGPSHRALGQRIFLRRMAFLHEFVDLCPDCRTAYRFCGDPHRLYHHSPALLGPYGNQFRHHPDLCHSRNGCGYSLYHGLQLGPHRAHRDSHYPGDHHGDPGHAGGNSRRDFRVVTDRCLFGGGLFAPAGQQSPHDPVGSAAAVATGDYLFHGV